MAMAAPHHTTRTSSVPTPASSSPASHVLAAGTVAGLISRFVIAPLDVVKIRLQLQSHGPPPVPGNVVGMPIFYEGILRTMRDIARHEGITALWKGNVPAEFLYCTYGAAQFFAYHKASVVCKAFDISDGATSFVAGAAAGGAATIATYPLDLLRTRFAAQGRVKIYNNLRHSVGHIYKEEGPKGFFRGSGAAVVQIVPYMAIFFYVYEYSRHEIADNYLLPTWIPFGTPNAVAGGFAAFVGKTCVFPLDLIRKRLQVQGPTRDQYAHRNMPVYAGITGAATTIFRSEGIRGLYKGLGVSVVKAVPLSAITMTTYEWSLGVLNRWYPEDRQA